VSANDPPESATGAIPLEHGRALPRAGDRTQAERRAELTDAAAGRRIGPYEIVRALGEGGMGAVFLAQRTDPEFRQMVAIKLMGSALPSAEAVARFKLERQTLAELVHPNIARLLDGGTTDEGLPFLVLEYVEGAPIDRHCQERDLGVEARIELFLKVSDAVAHAHRNLVVHRDLKPGNIQVTGAGEPKLLDFGIAKLLGDGPGVGGDPTVTRLMTAAWASPEQLRGQPVTTATDVHALGLLLYLLLSREHPFAPGEATTLAVAHSILENDAARPSSVVRDRALAKRLSGDLDTIVLRALAKEPERRYPSAAALAEDLRRHLAGRPVTAYPDSLAYRARKFVVRHRLGVAAAAVATIALAAGATMAIFQAAEARRERDRAASAADRAERMNAFLRSVLAAPDPVHGGARDLKVADLLDRASRRLATELSGQPAIEADLRLTLGETYYNLGELEEAEREIGRSLALSESGGAGETAIAAARLALAKTLNELGRWPEAEAAARRALADLVPPAPAAGSGEARPAALDGRLRDVLGVSLQNQGKSDEAIAVGRDAVASLRAADDRGSLAAALNNLAIALGNRGEIADAEALHRESVEQARAEWGDEHPQVAEALANLAGALDMQGKFDDALPIYREALALQEELLGEQHFDVVRTLTSYANLLALMHRPAEAEPVARRARELSMRSLGGEHPLTAYAENILGGALLDLGRAREAEEVIRAALEKRRRLLAPGHWLIASAQSNLGAALLEQGRRPEARRELEEAYRTLLADRGPEHEKTKLTAERLARLNGRPG